MAILLEIDEESRSFINVRRSQIWVDSCRHLNKKKFNPKAAVSIKFADSHGGNEGAVDAGGPRREYFRLLLRAVNLEAGIFCGPEDNRVLFKNATARSKGYYILAGKIIAWSLVQGGPAANFFSRSLYNAIAFNGNCRQTCMEDIADIELREKLTLISDASSIDDINKILEDNVLKNMLEAQGALPFVSDVNEKTQICTLLVQHALLDSVQFLLNELKEGLETFGVLESIQRYPEKFREVFFMGEMSKLDAQLVDLLFIPNYDEEGSNIRFSQEEAVVYFRDYLQDCMDGDAEASLTQVFIFATGAYCPPPLGFDNEPSLEFTEGKFPKANTCVPVLYLPLGHSEYSTFKTSFDFGVLNSPRFGKA
ncbi:G2/M phase-specific E3 ubiquitin-protein ligase-like [Xenia sp. Carnegie-2017]|uniref:G2/M phase-specific E3 ubiquitin-protein ligase-like n=1 Tax=Xenia sp. Carnegie-2017 TaxID=2897299 RepID=UPI001F04878A|nr:G2/M phase-specific E3 ubiquitin-protein ligase-like [Xenia sp. Carnegie-2017]